MLSSCSETSTDVPATTLDESLSTEESCSLQASSSGASSEDNGSGWILAKSSKKLSSKKVVANTEGSLTEKLAATPDWGNPSQQLSNAILRCTQSDGSTGALPQKKQQLPPQNSSEGAASVPCKEAGCKKALGGQPLVSKSSGDNANIVGKALRPAAPVKSQVLPEGPATKYVEIDPLGSTWIHNGRRDDAAEWRLVHFQPLWRCSDPDVPHVPVSIQAVDAGARLVIDKTFLNLEVSCVTSSCNRRRAHSLDARLSR